MALSTRVVLLRWVDPYPVLVPCRGATIAVRQAKLVNAIRKHHHHHLVSSSPLPLWVPSPPPPAPPVVGYGVIRGQGQGRKLDRGSLILSVIGGRGGEGGDIKLDVAKLPHFAFFPGQVVGVSGWATGRCFIVKEVFLPPLPPSPPPPIFPYPTQPTAAPPSILLCQGPFVAGDEPFPSSDGGEGGTTGTGTIQRLREVIRAHRPRWVLLMGPFVDAEDPRVATGDLEAPYPVIFRRILRDLMMEETCCFLVVPSLRDVHHPNVFPQGPFPTSSIPPPPPPPQGRDVVSLSNPSLFQLGGEGGTTVGVSCTDLLADLEKEELVREPPGSPSSDPLSRMCHHALSQWSFYPLMATGPVNNLNTVTNLNWDQLLLPQCQLDLLPELLVVASPRMPPFIRKVDSVLVVNPGSCSSSSVVLVSLMPAAVEAKIVTFGG